MRETEKDKSIVSVEKISELLPDWKHILCFVAVSDIVTLQEQNDSADLALLSRMHPSNVHKWERNFYKNSHD